MSSPSHDHAPHEHRNEHDAPAGHDHQPGHVHGLSRGDEVAGISDARLLWSVALNQLLTVGQVAAGLISGSVALLSDAAHNFNDANALLIAYIARRISRRPANRRFTFGYRRAETIGALINLTLLAVIGLYLVYEGVMRFFEPVEIMGGLMAGAALLALIVDLGTALLLWQMSRGSLNVRAAFLHNLVDALGSLAVLLGAAAIIWLDWTWIDPLLTLLIASYVLWQVARLLPQAIRVLMEGTPPDFPLDTLIARIESLDGVADLHHLHIWQLDETHRALEAHITIPEAHYQNLPQIKRQIKACLASEFQITHSTLEFELPGEEEDEHDRGMIVGH